MHPQLKLTIEKCDGCGRCIPVCPTKAIRLEAQLGKTKVEINRELCNDCLLCIDMCYTGALEYFGQRITVDKLFDIIKRDTQYYRASKGGVTIGGGEPTAQPLFSLALLRKCRENYIHTAVDTCGYTPNNDGFSVLEEADLLLFDLKGIDAQKHRQNTSVSNDVILSNLQKLGAMGKSIIIRVPLVPGYTDSAENVNSTAEFLARLKSVERVDLMSYHEYGTVKYQQLGREYRLNVQSLGDEELNNIKTVFESYGLNVQLGG